MVEEEWTKQQLICEVEALRQRIAQLEAGDSARQHLDTFLSQDQNIEISRAVPRGIINEFNNVLTAILGYTELALSDVPHTSRAWGFLQRVYTAGERATRLVQRIRFELDCRQKRRAARLRTTGRIVCGFGLPRRQQFQSGSAGLAG